ncbi:MAG: DUF2071 domain-containing protein [Actinomycetota bacterium]
MVPQPSASGAGPGETITAETPRPVQRPVMLQRWDSLTYVHWPVDPDQVAALLPPGVAVDTFDGAAWVGLVPFEMQRIRLPGTPAVPWVGTFPETNVRTYVVLPDGRRAVWFSTLDVPRAAAVAVARAAFGLPYRWAAASVTRDGDLWRYRSQRRWPHDRARLELDVRVGEPIAAAEVSPLEHWLTARWGLATHHLGRWWHGAVDHPPWPLHRAELVELNDELVDAAGFRLERSILHEPLVHATPGVEVRIGWLQRA